MAEEKLNPKNYCKVEILAQLFGVTVRRVQQLVQDGIISSEQIEEDGKKVTRYNTIICVRDYIKYLSDKAYGREQRNKEEELRQKKLKAEIGLKESQGDLHKLRMEIASGKYIDIEQVQIDYSRFFIVFKKFALSIPDRVANRLMGSIEPVKIREVENDINGEIRSMLTDFVVAGNIEENPENRLPKRGRPKKTENAQI